MSTGKTLNILFDSWSTQVMLQHVPSSYPSGKAPFPPTFLRLNTLLGAIESIGQGSASQGWPAITWTPTYTDPPITAAQLEGIDIYISLTRFQGTDFEYTDDELDLLENWVKTQGGKILLMTNHGGMPSARSDDYSKNDGFLAARFGITLEDYYVSGQGNGVYTMTVSDTIPELAVNVNSIASHNSCIIVPPTTFTSIAEFPDSWNAYDPKTNKRVSPPPSPYFSIMVPGAGAPQGSGQVLVIGNSGWVGDQGSPFPAPGMITVNNNLQFVLNCIGYLGGFPMPGI